MPRSIRGTTPSVMASVCSPRCLWFVSAASTAFGMPPTPIWSVAPSGMSSAMWRPMRLSISLGTQVGSSTSGSSTSTAASIFEMWISASPYEKGMAALTCAMTVLAHSTAGTARSAETP